ncbi:m7gpppn-mRNA hydrolase [Anaeramoeba ignava]|uniref:M7gpppn-mRNA hydrolase n=1 Tax=Anaeramoeba ignava TaxID=1746090 RepID=A0A9Q0LUS2_ANAIG|nr:m7gpppn-mRNA hydrolase [Anaeramoeba ignava]
MDLFNNSKPKTYFEWEDPKMFPDDFDIPFFPDFPNDNDNDKQQPFHIRDNSKNMSMTNNNSFFTNNQFQPLENSIQEERQIHHQDNQMKQEEEKVFSVDDLAEFYFQEEPNNPIDWNYFNEFESFEKNESPFMLIPNHLVQNPNSKVTPSKSNRKLSRTKRKKEMDIITLNDSDYSSFVNGFEMNSFANNFFDNKFVDFENNILMNSFDIQNENNLFGDDFYGDKFQDSKPIQKSKQQNEKQTKSNQNQKNQNQKNQNEKQNQKNQNQKNQKIQNQKIQNQKIQNQKIQNQKSKIQNQKIQNEQQPVRIIKKRKRAEETYMDPIKNERELIRFFAQKPKPRIGERLDKIASIYTDFVEGWGSTTFSDFINHGKIPDLIKIDNRVFWIMARVAFPKKTDVHFFKKKAYNARRGVSKFLKVNFKMSNNTGYKHGRLIFQKSNELENVDNNNKI